MRKFLVQAGVLTLAVALLIPAVGCKKESETIVNESETINAAPPPPIETPPAAITTDLPPAGDLTTDMAPAGEITTDTAPPPAQ